MNNLEDLIRESFPFNREERFYTATVLPGIICRDNFSHFGAFLQLLEPDLELQVSWSASAKNILFYTEYSPRKSILAKSLAKGEERVAGDTPDVVFIVFAGDKKYLFALEAKMFQIEREQDITAQVDKQKKVLKQLAKKAGVKDAYIFHYALLPQQLLNAYKGKDIRYVTWESILSAFLPLLGAHDYYLEVLRYALDNYERLKGVALNFSSNAVGELRGLEILLKHQELGITRIGRKGGVNGKRFCSDVVTGKWRMQEYQYGTDDRELDDWFSIAEFIQKVEGR